VLGDGIENFANERTAGYLTSYTMISNCENWNRKFWFMAFRTYQTH